MFWIYLSNIFKMDMDLLVNLFIQQYLDTIVE